MTAAPVATGILGGFATMQVALAAGAPLARHVWGGRFEDPVLEPGMRLVSAGAAGVLVGMATVVAARGGLLDRSPVPARLLPGATGAVAGYMALNTVGNLASESPVERWAFSPATATVAVAAAIVARRGPGDSREASPTGSLGDQ
jgi:hypothetical protein